MKVSASTNPPIESQMLSYIREVSQLDIDYIHCDIMDGHFVENKTYDYNLIDDIMFCTDKPLDVHLMIENVEQDYTKYIKCGVEIITIHYEAINDDEKLIKILQDISSHSIKAGLAIKPNTPFDRIKNILDYVDLLLVMSVEPGKSYQTFIEDTFEKLKEIDDYRIFNNCNFILEVDGGVNDKIAKKLKNIKVDIVVVGGYLYSSNSREVGIKLLKY